MNSSQRIIVNTIVTYGRTIFAMAMGLFSGRWLLQALGPIDYGLIGVVGALIPFVTLLNSMTSTSVARFFALSIGKGDPEETNRWFNTALSIHIILPITLVLMGWPIGEWAIRNFFNIPPDRLITACWVFRFSLIVAFWNMSATPYMGMFTAKQHFYEMSIWGVLQTVCTFTLTYLLTLYSGDAWLLYSAGSVSIMIILGLFQVLRARYLFDECRIKFEFWWNWRSIQQVTVFAGWQIFGGLARLLRGQGTAILLNKYFTPLKFPDVNASYAIGNNVSNYTQTLSTALIGAFTPEITATEGRGDRDKMLRYANRASKFGTMLVMLFAIPLLIEIKYILVLWLKTPPQYAWIFCVLILTQYLMDKVSIGYSTAVAAQGRIARYQMIVGGGMLLTLPIAWIFLAHGCSAVSVVYAFNITIIISSVGRVLLAQHLLGASCLEWIRKVLIPCVSVLCIGLSFGFLVQYLYGAPSLLRLMLVMATSSLSWCLCGWCLVLEQDEKKFLLENVRKLRCYVR
jgi:O-antigen/teichoic acid export membrane protein